MLTSLIRALKIPAPIRFIDIWSFDQDSAGFFPPMHAIALLYPCEAVDPIRRERYKNKLLGGDGVPGLVFSRQRMQEVGNACGSIAVVAALCNSPALLPADSHFAKFRQATVGKSAEATADALANAE